MINTITLLGNVGKDPEFRELQGGSKVAELSLATTEKYKDRNGNQVEDTQWHNIVLWGKLAELANEYVKKGHKIAIIGKVKYEDWEKDGQKHRGTKIIAKEMTFISKPQTGNQAPTATSENQSVDDLDDGLPF